MATSRSTTPEIRFLSNVGGKYAAFSNFTSSPFTLDGHEWQTVEHYFQEEMCFQ